MMEAGRKARNSGSAGLELVSMVRLSRTAVAVAVVGFLALSASGPVWAAAAAATGPKAPSDNPKVGDYLRARSAQLAYDWKNAGQFMRAAWKADPENTQLRHEALLLSVAGGDFTEAVAVARQIPQDSPDITLARLVLATDDILAKRYAAAIEKLKALPDQGAERYLRPLMTAWAEVGLGHKDAALAAIGALNNLQGAIELHAMQLGMVSEAIGDKAEATAQFKRLLTGSPSSRAILVAAQFFQRQGDINQARQAVERFDADGSSASARLELLMKLAANQRLAPVTDPRLGAAASFFEVAASLAQSERVDLGPLIYTRLALQLDPDFAEARILMAEIETKWGKREEAVAALLQVNPSSHLRTTAVRGAMANLVRLNKEEEALKLGRAALAEHPEDLDLAMLQADLLRGQSHYAESIKAYDSLLARIPATSSRKGLALFHRGIAYERAKQWPKAEADLQAALMLRPDDPGILNYLAFSWADQGINLDRARTMLDKALQLVPNDGAIVDSLGWVLYRQGHFDAAIQNLERAVSLESGDAAINDHLGDAYWRAGRRIEAQIQWDRALRMSDDKALSDQIRVKLKDGLPDPQHAANGQDKI